MNKKKIMVLLCGFYITTFAATVFSNAYMLTFLKRLGYDEMERGILVAGISVIAILSPIIFGYICDRFNTVKKVFNVTLILLTIFAVLFYQSTKQIFFLHLIYYSFLGGLWRTVMTLQDTWVIEIDDYFKDRYGPIRAFGAIGWMIANPLCGLIIEHYGYSILGWIFAGLSIFNLIYTMFIPDATKEEAVKPIKLRDLNALFKNKEYVLVVLTFLFINMMANADGLTTIEKMMSLGAQEALIGTRNSIQAFVELPLFFAGAILLKKFGDFKLMMFGTIMYIIRFFGYAVVQSPVLIIVVSLLQLFTFPLIMITSKTLISSATPNHLKSSGQTIGSSIYIGIPSLIAPILTGFLMSRIGVDFTLIVIGCFGFVSLVLGMMYKKHKQTISVQKEII